LAAFSDFWKTRTHNLERMSMDELVRAYFAYPAIQAYIALAAISIALAVYFAAPVWRLALAAVLAILVYPLIWYLLHRFVLHGRFLYRSRWTATAWKRIHFDHHQDPNDLQVLFGALYTTLPTVAIVTMPVGWLVGGAGAAAVAFAAGLLTTCFYEFCHCVQHLNYTPKSAFLLRIKRLHLAHHFHRETGNYGITNFLWDRLFGSFYAKAKDVPRSATVFNIGYTAAEAERFPWVQQLSNGIRRDGSPRPFGRGASDPGSIANDGFRSTGT
jgi:sterol desaturase/sphingolipid hydroxylase (fatty acid hydroxylase superfamily)